MNSVGSTAGVSVETHTDGQRRERDLLFQCKHMPTLFPHVLNGGTIRKKYFTDYKENELRMSNQTSVNKFLPVRKKRKGLTDKARECTVHRSPNSKEFYKK